MADLFGNPDRLESGAAPAASVSLFDETAEREALASGRNVAQVRAELAGYATIDTCYDRSSTSDVRPLFYDTEQEACAASVRTGRAVVLARHLQTCGACGATFFAAPRNPARCNLCRRAQA